MLHTQDCLELISVNHSHSPPDVQIDNGGTNCQWGPEESMLLDITGETMVSTPVQIEVSLLVGSWAPRASDAVLIQDYTHIHSPPIP
jgi:hypothetical protein